MLLLFGFALRSSVLWQDGSSGAAFFHQRYWNQTVSSGLLAAGHASLICFEELLSKSAPFISFCFPAYVPLIFALNFACINLTSRIRPRHHSTKMLLEPIRRLRLPALDTDSSSQIAAGVDCDKVSSRHLPLRQSLMRIQASEPLSKKRRSDWHQGRFWFCNKSRSINEELTSPRTESTPAGVMVASLETPH